MNAAVQSVAPLPATARHTLALADAPFAPVRMSPGLDPLSLEFVIAARAARAEMLDIGCGDGVAVLAALSRGAHVHAVDADPACIERLLARVPREQQPRLKTRVASLQTLDFMAPSFSGVLVARVLHLLDGLTIECTLKKCLRWLYPDGKLYLSALTPMGDFWQLFRADFARRMSLGMRWPGDIADVSRVLGSSGGRPVPVNLLDERILRRELDAAGFVVEEVCWYALPWDSQQVCCGVIARCGS